MLLLYIYNIYCIKVLMVGLLNARVCHDVIGKKYNKIV